MKTTTALAASMRQLLAKLHPPVPPTAREGQQLLDVLQKSFKARLDEHHPPPSQFDFWPRDHDSSDIPIEKVSTSSRATNVHLDTILTNPVLGSIDGLYTKEDAVSRFDKLVAEPQLDVPRLATLLRWYGREMKGSRKGQRGERLSDRLNSWLHITNTPSREAFLLNLSARSAALDLFANEGNATTLWTWLRLVYERTLVHKDITSPEWLDVEDNLVSQLMRISIRENNHTDAAQQFLEACRYRMESGRGIPTKDFKGVVPNTAYRPMVRSGKRLASAIIYHRNDHGIDTGLFAQVFQYLPTWHISPDHNSAFCAIYDPENPTTDPLYTHLRENTSADRLIQGLRTGSKASRRPIMIALLDASKLALDKGRKHQASFLLDFAVENYPRQLPAREKEQLEPEIQRYLELIPC